MREESTDDGKAVRPAESVEVVPWHPCSILSDHHAKDHDDDRLADRHHPDTEARADQYSHIVRIPSSEREQAKNEEMKHDAERCQYLTRREPRWHEPVSNVIIFLVEDPPASFVRLSD